MPTDPPPIIRTIQRGSGDGPPPLPPPPSRRPPWIGVAIAAGVLVFLLGIGILHAHARHRRPSTPRSRVEQTRPQRPSSLEGRAFVRDHIDDSGNCRVVAITRTNGDVVVCDRNNWASSGCPQGLNDALRQAEHQSGRITDVTLTESGRWLVLWDRNAGQWSDGLPPRMTQALREYNRNNEEIYSASFNDIGDWVVISDAHFISSDTYLQGWLADGHEKYGVLLAACVTADAAVACYQRGYKFMGNVPEGLKDALRKTSLDVRIVKIAGSSWFFADDDGSYQYSM